MFANDFFPPPYSATGNRTHVTRVTFLRGTCFNFTNSRDALGWLQNEVTFSFFWQRCNETWLPFIFNCHQLKPKVCCDIKRPLQKQGHRFGRIQPRASFGLLINRSWFWSKLEISSGLGLTPTLGRVNGGDATKALMWETEKQIKRKRSRNLIPGLGTDCSNAGGYKITKLNNKSNILLLCNTSSLFFPLPFLSAFLLSDLSCLSFLHRLAFMTGAW